MLTLLWLIPAFPLAGFVLLVLAGTRIRPRAASAIGVGSVGLSALVTLSIVASFLTSPPPGSTFTQTLWTWIGVGSFQPSVAFHLDPLSLVMLLVVTFVGFLIHLYSAAFMDPEEKRRFFAYMNLFVASMTVLVLANNFLLLYFGWEGVGLCSYLLIGFWYSDEANGHAARKAFITTRIGDVALAVGMFLLFREFGTLQFDAIFADASAAWTVGAPMATTVALLILGGAVGKSAQLPLQTWLPDAMAGPTPVSALIHAATMVTAGVYLIARTHVLFQLAPDVQLLVGVIGAATLVLSGFSALTQNDIKRVLAYSTISQIGYMFLALGVGAWTAAIFHLMTHAFFKALLFLAAGVVIQSMDDEHNIFRMGGLRRDLPLAFWSFIIGGSALAGLPLVTAGFYSKDLILWDAAASPQGGLWLWGAGLLGVLLTSLYIYRVIFMAFFGDRQKEPTNAATPFIRIACGTLCVLAVGGGFVNLPESLGGSQPLSALLSEVLPTVTIGPAGGLTELSASLLSAGAYFAGLGIAYLLFIALRQHAAEWMGPQSGSVLYSYFKAGWGFDWIYDRFLVRPLIFFARVDRNDLLDFFFERIGDGTQAIHRWLAAMETGRIRWYAAGIAVGVVFLIAVRLRL